MRGKVVRTPRGGGPTSRRRVLAVAAAITLSITACNLGAKPVVYQVAGGLWGSWQTRAVDLDVDGHADLMKGETVMFGDGNGGFSTAPLRVPTAFPTRRVVLDRVDADDYVDLVGLGDSGVYLSRGDGSGGFGPPVQIAPGDSLLFEITIGDLNADAHADLVTIHGLNGGEARLGDGAGGFGSPAALAMPQFIVGQGSLIEDLDEDGNADLVVTATAQGAGGGAVAVLRGDGTGAFGSPVFHPVHPGSGNTACDLVLDDFDGDGDADAVVGGGTGASASFFLGTGTGTFGPAIEVPAVGSCSIEAGDIDGDGHTDLVGPSPTGGATRVSFGDGTGRFSDAHGLGGGRALVHDLDGDSRLDVVVAAADTAEVFMNRLNGRPTH